jgi:hypothetical protein
MELHSSDEILRQFGAAWQAGMQQAFEFLLTSLKVKPA